MDDLEYHAFALRPRDAEPGPFRVPDARTLGQRLAGMRLYYNLSVADVADAAGLRHSIIEEFEEYGAVSGESLLWLIEVLCQDDCLADAFIFPSFIDRDDLLSRRSHTAAEEPERLSGGG